MNDSFMNGTASPAFDDLKRQFFAERPRDVDGVANASALYYRRSLLRKIFARFDFTGLPKEWDVDYFLTTLFLNGMLCVTDTAMGVLPLRTGIAGQNVFQHPTRCVIANPVLGSFERTIDEDCVLWKLQYDYTGVYDIVNRYSTMLAMCDSSLAVNLMNSKVAFIGLASTKAKANTLKKMYDEISCGNPAVFGNEDAINPTNFFFNNVKQNFVGIELQTVKRGLIDEFLTEIGIANANTDKKERLISDEVNANNEEVFCNIEHWLMNLKEGAEKVNAMFGLSLGVELKKWKGAGIEPDESDSVSGDTKSDNVG